VLIGQISAQGSVTGKAAARAVRSRDADSSLGPLSSDKEAAEVEGGAERPALAVVGSGNLGGIWFPRLDGRQTIAQIEGAYPGLLAGIVAHPGISFATVMTDAGPVAIGVGGSIDLRTGVVTGENPLEPFGVHAQGDLLRIAEFSNAPDVYVNSLYNSSTDEVAAFEELVGCHGGLGGWQTQPMIVHPSGWTIDADLTDQQGHLHGAPNVYRQLVRWLEQQGHRQNLG
jgi:hypothetical protein